MHTKGVQPRPGPCASRYGSVFTAGRCRRVAGCLAILLAGFLVLGSQCLTPPGTDEGDEDSERPLPARNVTLHTNLGRIVIELYHDQAPQAAANLLQYVEQGYYDNTVFHESNESATLVKAGAYPLNAQVSPWELTEPADRLRTLVNESDNGLKNTRGQVALFGPADRATGLPSLLINLGTNSSLDHSLTNGRPVDYTVVGRVVEGQSIADRIGGLRTVHRATAAGTPLTRIPLTTTDFYVRIIQADTGITSAPANAAPQAEAGADQSVGPRALVTLDGSASVDPGGDPLQYLWEVSEQSQADLEEANLAIELSDATSAQASFTAPDSASLPPDPLEIILTVTDDRGGQGRDRVLVQVASNSSPAADAGPDQTVYRGDSVSLDGSGSSDPDGDELTYGWVQVSGTEVTIAGEDTAEATFTAPNAADTLVFELTVSDGISAAQKDTVTITVTGNRPPVANAGSPQSVFAGDPVTLDGTGSSDSDGDVLSYSWSQSSGTPVTLTNADTAEATFTAPDTAGVLEFELSVSDGTNPAQTDTVQVTVAANHRPAADAGPDQEVAPEADVTLDGSASSDPDGDELTYAWTLTQESKDALETAGLQVTLDDAAAEKPKFTAPVPSETLELVFELTVTDENGAECSDPDTVTITVDNNRAPLARAGADQTVQPGDTVRFDGSSSSDPDGDTPLTYAWAITPESETLLAGLGLDVPAPATTETYSFEAPAVDEPTVLTFGLTVTDSRGKEATDRVQARILPIDFEDAVSKVVGGSPAAIATGDFDNDGKPDIAVAKSGTDEVAILLNDGDGALLDAVVYSVGDSPESIVAADFNQDGHPDIATAAKGDDQLYVLLNNGDGTFTVGTSFALGDGPAGLISADLDGAYGPDVVAVNVNDDTLSVRLNDGDGEFSTGITDLAIPAKDEDENPIATTGLKVVAAGQLDTDSRSDLVAAYATTNNATVLLGKGDGQFNYGSVFDVGLAGSEPRAIIASDLDGNATADVALVLNVENEVAVRRNSGDGTFGLEARYATGSNPSALAVADIDGDGRPDLIVANEDDNTVSILQNKGGGSFKPKLDLALDPGDAGPVGVAAADLNGDEALDLVVVSQASGTVTVRLSRTSAAFAAVDADGFTRTHTWLKYKDVDAGTGDPVTSDATIVARYTGRLDDENGTVFDTTEGTEDEAGGRQFSLDSVVKGWKEGLGGYGMNVGGTRQLIIPPELGYGATGQGAKIPPNATLWFEVEVLEVVP